MVLNSASSPTVFNLMLYVSPPNNGILKMPSASLVPLALYLPLCASKIICSPANGAN